LNRIVRLMLLAAVAFVAFSRATCGKPRPSGPAAVLKMTIKDHVRYHNMGITWDGSHYFTINGGSENHSNLNEYDGKGRFVASHDVGVDGRAIFYHPDDEELYVKVYGANLNAVDLDDETSDAELEDVFQDQNSSPGFAPDGEQIYEFSGGTVRVLDFSTGDELSSFELANHSRQDDNGLSMSIAASDKYLFTWGAGGEVLVYGLDGKYVTSFSLPKSGYGYSLSWANGMLWVAEDAGGKTEGADGYWYGYQLTGLQ